MNKEDESPGVSGQASSWQRRKSQYVGGACSMLRTLWKAVAYINGHCSDIPWLVNTTVVFYPRGTSGSYLLTLTKESSYLFFLITANTLNFTVRFSCGKTHTADCCFVSGFN